MDVAAGPWGGPNNVEVVLVRMRPHKAGEEFQARRRLFLGLLKHSSIRSESRDNFRVGVRESVLGIRSEQQNEGCLWGNGICHSFVKRAADTKW